MCAACLTVCGLAGTLVTDAQEGGSMTFKVVVKRGEDGYFVANCPSLKSCWSQGKSKEEALANNREAITLHLEAPPKELVQDSLA